jgi:hypothetical protein
MLLKQLLALLEGVRKTNEHQYSARCPAHEDKRPSLSIKDDIGSERLLVHCYKGCSTEEVLTSIGLRYGDLFYSEQAKPLPLMYERASRNPFVEKVEKLREEIRAGRHISPQDCPTWYWKCRCGKDKPK